MKKKIKDFCVVILACGSISNANAGGGSGSHAGDILIGSFTATTENIINAIEEHPEAVSCPNVGKLRDVMYFTPEEIKARGDERSVRIQYTPKEIVIVDGRNVDADNGWRLVEVNGKLESEPYIILSRTNLKPVIAGEIEKEPGGYLVLALHEHSVLIGHEKSFDTRKTRACLKELETAGVKLGTLVYRVEVFSNFEDQFVKGNAYLNCPEPEGKGTYRVYIELVNSLADSGYIRRQQGWLRATYTEDAASAPKTLFVHQNDSFSGRDSRGFDTSAPNPYEKLFSWDYAVKDGKLTTSFSKVLKSDRGIFVNPDVVLSVSSTNHMDWNVEGKIGEGMKPRNLKKVSLKCSPVLKVERR